MNNWISVKERVPMKRELVIVTNIDSPHDIEHWVCCAELDKDGYWCNQFILDDKIIVTHWMPLPEPPKSNQ